jgi:hypothetical protein
MAYETKFFNAERIGERDNVPRMISETVSFAGLVAIAPSSEVERKNSILGPQTSGESCKRPFMPGDMGNAQKRPPFTRPIVISE